MKNFLVKIGKVYKTIKRGGILAGLSVILAYLVTFLRNIFWVKNSGDILIITDGVGDSAFYRAHNQAEELNLHGFRCSHTISDNPFLPSYADNFKIFIFHRTRVTPKIHSFIEKIKKQNKVIIFDTDDLVYDPKKFQETESYKSMNALEKKQYEKGIGDEFIRDPYVKVCTVPTSFLAEEIEKLGKKVFVSMNKLCNHDLEIADEILKNQKPKTKNQELIKIGYFSGTLSHNKDFATITDALMQIMEKYPQVRLILAGPMDIENKLNTFKNRIEQLPYVAREKHFANVASVDINLSPLEIGNPFCESKSELKFFGVGILGVPTVASATQTFKEAISDGVDGFVAGSTAEWVEKLGKLITDPEFRMNMGKFARDKALAKYSNKNSHNEIYYGYLKNILSSK